MGPSGAQTADEAFTTRVKTLEEQVVDLKEKIYRSKARLLLLQETVLGGDLSTGARAVLFHKNEMGDSFVLESVAYALDGAPIFTKVNEDGDLDKLEEFEIFNGRIVPGQHQVAVRLVYRGNGYGVFSYLEGYKFKVQSSYTFNAERRQGDHGARGRLREGWPHHGPEGPARGALRHRGVARHAQAQGRGRLGALRFLRDEVEARR